MIKKQAVFNWIYLAYKLHRTYFAGWGWDMAEQDRRYWWTRGSDI